MSWEEHQRALIPTSSTLERLALAETFAARTINRFDLAHSVGGRERTEGLHLVVPYKEAFSPTLVRTLLTEMSSVPGPLIDPFVGSGTTLLAAAETGRAAVGVDVLPFAVFASSTLLASPTADWSKIKRSLTRILDHAPRRTGTFPDFAVRSWAFTPAALAELTALDDAIKRCRPGIEADVLRLALLCTVERVSQATKDGTSLRRREHGGRRQGRFGARRTKLDVQEVFQERLEQIKVGAKLQPQAPKGSKVLLGDACKIGSTFHRNTFGAALFSPPYPNRYDYVSNYQLELGFGFIENRAGLTALRKSQLRSHLEAPWPACRTVKLPALDEFLSALTASPLKRPETSRVFRMIAGYFEDMSMVLEGLAKTLKPGAPMAIVVGTQSFNGEALPTDLLLSELAEHHGLATEAIWVARRKGVPVQQRARGATSGGSRESIVFLKKPANDPPTA